MGLHPQTPISGGGDAHHSKEHLGIDSSWSHPRGYCRTLHYYRRVHYSLLVRRTIAAAAGTAAETAAAAAAAA